MICIEFENTSYNYTSTLLDSLIKGTAHINIQSGTFHEQICNILTGIDLDLIFSFLVKVKGATIQSSYFQLLQLYQFLIRSKWKNIVA